MLDQRKIIAMVQVAMLEKEIGQEALDTAKYYREDYISNRVLRGILQYTGIFFLLLLAYFLMEIENILQKLDFQYMMDLGKRISLLYFLGMVCTIVLISIVSYYSYERAYEDSLLYRERLEDLLLLSTAKRTEKLRKKDIKLKNKRKIGCASFPTIEKWRVKEKKIRKARQERKIGTIQ